jgi:hypothetical protein
MKPLLLSCCFFVLGLTAFAQPASINPFLGHWEGTLFWYQTGRSQPRKIKMQLIIQPTDTANVYTWQIIYGEKGQDNRPYLLRPVDTATGHWQIDEQNGIVLEQYFTGNRFIAAFTVQSTTIVDSYWREGKKLIAEFYSLTAKPAAITGQGTEDSPKVNSYGMKGYQKAVLQLRKSAPRSKRQ